MKAHTSIRAWRSYKGTKAHISKREKVHQFIKNNDLCTAKEISRNIPGGWKRVSELIRDGLIRRAGIRQATARNGVAAYTYSANSVQTVMTMEKNISWKQLYFAQVKELLALRAKIKMIKKGFDI